MQAPAFLKASYQIPAFRHQQPDYSIFIIFSQNKKAMSSRSKILKAIKQNKPELSPLPAMQTFEENASADLLAYYQEVIKLIGGQARVLPHRDLLAGEIRQMYPEHKIICSSVPDLDIATLQLQDIKDPHDLKDVDLAVIPGNFAVAENGAIWVTDKDLVHRAVAFICQHMVLVVPRQRLVWNMHQAYQQLNIPRPGYGLFIAGPSKTADIEQSLVIGAHGARSLTVFFV